MTTLSSTSLASSLQACQKIVKSSFPELSSFLSSLKIFVKEKIIKINFSIKFSARAMKRPFYKKKIEIEGKASKIIGEVKSACEYWKNIGNPSYRRK